MKSKRIFETISNVGNEIGQDAFVIGGYVRDQLLNRETKDIDIVAIGSGIDFAKKTAKKLNSSPPVSSLAHPSYHNPS